jgi:hypothetical protein
MAELRNLEVASMGARFANSIAGLSIGRMN